MAQRVHGRYGVLYVSITSGGSAQPLLYTKSFNLDAKTDRVDVTSFQDTSKVYVAGLPDSTASIDGFWDSSAGFANFSLYQAAVDGIARKWYFYPAGGASPFAAGTGYFDCSFSQSVDGAVAIKGTMSAATPTFTSG